MCATRRMVSAASGRRTPGRGQASWRRRRDARRRRAWTVPRWRGCGWTSSPGARNRISAAAARFGPVPQLGELGQVSLAVQADEEGAAGARGASASVAATIRRVPRNADEVQVAAQAGAVEPLIDLRDLTAQVRYLRGQGGETLTESLRAGFSGRAADRPPSRKGGRDARRSGSARAPRVSLRRIRVTVMRDRPNGGRSPHREPAGLAARMAASRSCRAAAASRTAARGVPVRSAAPDPVHDPVADGELQALLADRALRADLRAGPAVGALAGVEIRCRCRFT